MPKPMTMTIEVEEVAFGRVFRTLDAMDGVISIHIRGKGPKKSAPLLPKGNGTLPKILLGVLAHSPAGKDVLDAAAINGGKKAVSVQNAIQILRKRKLIAGGGKGGVYKLTKAGVTAATQEEK